MRNGWLGSEKRSSSHRLTIHFSLFHPRLWAKWRPKSVVGNIGKLGVSFGRDGWDLVDRLRTEIVPEHILSGRAKMRFPFQISGPIGDGYNRAGLPLGFNCILIDSRFDQPQIVLHSRSLRSFPRPNHPRQREGSQQRNHPDYNHDFDQGKPCPSS
jgi:hypothetical protein